MSDSLLVEIGTEELPPKALRSLMDAFRDRLAEAIDAAGLARGEVRGFASPRRLAVHVDALADSQPDRQVRQKGPPVRIAFDDDGKPTAAAKAFAKKCGVVVDELSREQTDKGEWLVCDTTQKGRTAEALLPELVGKALDQLPIPRRMRWGAGDAEFVRPVHWAVLLHGNRVTDTSLLGVRSGRETEGHRVHGEGRISIADADSYLDVLEKEGRVIADYTRRREMVRDGAMAAAASVGGKLVDGESLFDEVTALVEWPVPLVGNFESRYLELPREVVISTLTGHQRYFPVANEDGRLLPHFVTIANLESKDPERVRDGNERVIRPRLADAAFFWDSDRKTRLDVRRQDLGSVVYQRDLGSMADKSARVAALCELLAAANGADSKIAARAAELAKCDLVTGMVGEFPELQGTMGHYYAAADGELAEVAAAIGEQYLPRFAGDSLPQSRAGQALAVADKLDTLAGIFSIGKKPSGSRDPFGLRRAALGVIRILIECDIDVDLGDLVARAVESQPDSATAKDAICADVLTFIGDRLKSFFLERDPYLDVETFDAVMARRPASLTDFARRLEAVKSFAGLPQSGSLAAANKRIANILKKADVDGDRPIDPALITEAPEMALYAALEDAEKKAQPLLLQREYTELLNALASLRDPVDTFFDDVMVMADDAAVRNNRLALLGRLRSLFLEVADISRLANA